VVSGCAGCGRQVIQTASKVLKGEFTAREAITILVTLKREAESAARELREIDLIGPMCTGS
jgi:hypothetical protein